MSEPLGELVWYGAIVIVYTKETTIVSVIIWCKQDANNRKSENHSVTKKDTETVRLRVMRHITTCIAVTGNLFCEKHNPELQSQTR